VPAGELAEKGTPIGAHCRVVGAMNERVSPVDGKRYAIGFEMRLPQAWNGRFFYQANGGVDGNVLPATE
jgi:feruloyl esterase